MSGSPFLLPPGNVQIAFSGGRTSGRMLHDIIEANQPWPADARAEDLAELLMHRLCQHSYSIVGPETTRWYSRRPVDLHPTEARNG